MSHKDSQSDAASSVGDQSDAGSEKGGSGGGSQGDAAEFLKETKFSFKVWMCQADATRSSPSSSVVMFLKPSEYSC